MPLIVNADAPSFSIPGVEFRAVASPSRGTAETALWRARLTPGAAGLTHHMTREEIVLAVAGEGVVTIGDDRYDLRPGDAFAIPAFTDFSLSCAGETPFEAIVALPTGGRAVIGEQPAFQPPWSI